MKATRKFKDYSLKHAKIRKTKKVKGFTLVELIVVIAIIGVLAVLLIPNMMGKVAQARLQTANDSAAKIAEQANIISAEVEANGSYTCSNQSYKKSAAFAANSEFATAMEKALGSSFEGVYAIQFAADGMVSSVVYAKTEDTKYVGAYPTPTKLDDGDVKLGEATVTNITGCAPYNSGT